MVSLNSRISPFSFFSYVGSQTLLNRTSRRSRSFRSMIARHSARAVGCREISGWFVASPPPGLINPSGPPAAPAISLSRTGLGWSRTALAPGGRQPEKPAEETCWRVRVLREQRSLQSDFCRFDYCQKLNFWRRNAEPLTVLL
jgi:hypothetical protein